MMTLSEYQKQASKTAQYPDIGNNPYYPTMGLCGEAGEVAEKVKKVMRDNGGVFDKERKDSIKKELGDVLWYVSQLANELGFDLDDIAEENISKLQSRKDRGKISGDGDTR
jgi:NTP pyrophosphatase (non-canonical NTP hydrolase)